MINTTTHQDSIARTGKPIGENTTSLKAQEARLLAELAERKALDAKAGGTERVTVLEDGSVVTVRSDDDENGDPLWETYYQDASDASCCSESREHGDLPAALAYHDSIAGAGVTKVVDAKVELANAIEGVTESQVRGVKDFWRQVERDDANRPAVTGSWSVTHWPSRA